MHVTPKLTLKETMAYCSLKHTTLSIEEMSSPGGEGTEEIFIPGGSAPRLNPLPFYFPFLAEKGTPFVYLLL